MNARVAIAPGDAAMGLGACGDALALHAEVLVFDGQASADVLQERSAQACLEAGVNAATVAVAVDEDWDLALRNFDRHLSTIEQSPLLALCRTADDVLSAKRKGKLGVVIGTQGASMIQEAAHFWRLDLLVRMGLRVLGLTHIAANALGDGCGELRDAGLSYLGEELIERVNTLPLMLDLSHCGHRTRAEAAAIARAPVCTHSNSEAIRINGRNTRDATVRMLAGKGGVIGVCAVPQTLSQTGTPTLDDLLDHIDHLVKLVGVDHVGIGMDHVHGFPEQEARLASRVIWRARRPDIFGSLSSSGRQRYPLGVESVRELSNLTQGLLNRGYSAEQVRALIGGSWLKAMRRFCG
jgi:membrane dipeptidase